MSRSETTTKQDIPQTTPHQVGRNSALPAPKIKGQANSSNQQKRASRKTSLQHFQGPSK